MVSKVVSIEDESEISELLRLVLFSPGIELFSADNGRDGLVLIRQVKPDLVMLDVMLPGGMNGWQVYDTIRGDEELKNTPVIMLTVMRAQPERRLAFTNSPIDLYVTKPFDALQLRREVERLLGGNELWKPPKPPVARAFGVKSEANKNETTAPPDEESKPVAADEKKEPTLPPAQPTSPDGKMTLPDEKTVPPPKPEM
ncbi:MAG TPA: response regulator [Aggregatilineaceae bacterium]|nr:response regulator [Aggregatilineaceae bacterium]